MVAITGEFAYATLDEILAAATRANEAPLVVLLDGITDPHNLGAIIRSAEVLGAHGVVIPEHRAAPVTPGTRLRGPRSGPIQARRRFARNR